MSTEMITKADAAATVLPIDDEERFAQIVLTVQTDEQAQEFIDNLKEMHDAVFHIKRLAHMRKQLTTLENKTYIQFYQSGYTKALRQVAMSLPKACEYILGKGDEYVQKVITGEYGTFTAIYSRHLERKRSEKAQQHALEAFENVRESQLEEFDKKGAVTIGAWTYSASINPRERKYVPDSLASDYADGTKDALLKRGACGVGNGKYVALNDEFDFRSAMDIRAESIARDLESLYKIMKDADERGISMYFELKGHNNVNRRLDTKSLVYITLLLNPNLRDGCWFKNVTWGFETEKVSEYFAFDAAMILDGDVDIYGNSSGTKYGRALINEIHGHMGGAL